MEKDPQKIEEQIIVLLTQLVELAGARVAKNSSFRKNAATLEKKDTSGATGGIRLLVEENKLDSPRQLPEIMEYLRQDGRHYSRPTVSMGLLNLVRERVLTRFRDKGDKKWKYAVRK